MATPVVPAPAVEELDVGDGGATGACVVPAPDDGSAFIHQTKPSAARVAAAKAKVVCRSATRVLVGEAVAVTGALRVARYLITIPQPPRALSVRVTARRDALPIVILAIHVRTRLPFTSLVGTRGRGDRILSMCFAILQRTDCGCEAEYRSEGDLDGSLRHLARVSYARSSIKQSNHVPGGRHVR